MSSSEEISIQQIFNEIIQTKNELKNAIQASEARVRLDFEAQKNRVIQLEAENKNLKEKIELLERNSRKNNIVIFGLRKKFEEISPERISKEINELLKINLTVAEISDIYPLGRSFNCPIKIELVSFLTKKLIFKNSKNLRGTNVYIVNDLTETQRVENNILRKHMKKAKETVSNTAYIKGNKLVVNEIPYSIEDLEPLEEEDETTQTRVNSAPPTPGTQRLVTLRAPTEEQLARTLDREKTSPLQNTPITKKPLRQENIIIKPSNTRGKLRSHSTKESNK